jgi:large subunit ribosomal protein L19
MSMPFILSNAQKLAVEEILKTKKIDKFRVGDTLAVKIKVLDGTAERTTVFQGVCIRKTNAGLLSAVTLRKITAGTGVEKTIPLYSPLTVSLEVVKRGKVRRATLNYLRKISGALKIKERFAYKKNKDSTSSK